MLKQIPYTPLSVSKRKSKFFNIEHDNIEILYNQMNIYTFRADGQRYCYMCISSLYIQYKYRVTNTKSR